MKNVMLLKKKKLFQWTIFNQILTSPTSLENGGHSLYLGLPLNGVIITLQYNQHEPYNPAYE